MSFDSASGASGSLSDSSERQSLRDYQDEIAQLRAEIQLLKKKSADQRLLQTCSTLQKERERLSDEVSQLQKQNLELSNQLSAETEMRKKAALELAYSKSNSKQDDIAKMKTLMKQIIAQECYGRDKNGINGLLRNIDTALIAAVEIGLRRPSVIALLLYRPVYKQVVPIEKVQELFGEEITLMIRRLLKTSDLYARNTAVNSENFHHLLFSFAEDVRVILLMIADRLCLMRLGKKLQEEDRVRLATEAAYLYAPLAHRLGLYAIKSELEDLSLKYTDRKQFDFIKQKLNETKRSRDAYIAQFIAPIKQKLEEAGFKFEIKGRTKSIHSINNKLKKQKIEFENIYDLFAIRVVLDTPLERERSECWQVYSIITDMYQPNPKRLKDWISIPKSNGYESLHITVMGPQNKWVEVQIRTKRMDEIAERGLAAHWRYKGIKAESGLDEFMNTVRAALENKSASPLDLMQDFKMDLYKDEIYVFTPTGELIKLAKGATVLDFAFSIHSQLGSRCVSARVNGRNVPIKYVLHNGDSVEIVTSPTQSPTAGVSWKVSTRCVSGLTPVAPSAGNSIPPVSLSVLQEPRIKAPASVSMQGVFIAIMFVVFRHVLQTGRAGSFPS